VATTTMTYYLWAPSTGDHFFACGAISRPPHCQRILQGVWFSIGPRNSEA